MICIVCSDCMSCFRAIGEENEIHHLVGAGSDFWPNKYHCIACNGVNVECVKEQALSVLDFTVLKLRDLQPVELFAALHGEGLPEEMGCNAEVVQQTLLTKTIKKVFATNIPNTPRSIIESILFEDGTRLYLAASTYGAVVYRITKAHSFAGGV